MKSKIILKTQIFEYPILAFVIAAFFIPQYSSQIPFIHFLFNIFFVIYNIYYTVITCASVVGVFGCFAFVNTDKINNFTKNLHITDIDKKRNIFKTILTWVESVAMIFFCFSYGRYYASVLNVITLISSILIFSMRDDLTVKTAKVALQNMGDEDPKGK
jgi:hypothetical protein